jgi:hypothetical protein
MATIYVYSCTIKTNYKTSIMKKLALVLLAIVSLSTSVKAQDSFYEGIEKFKGVEFQEIYNLDAVPEKKGYYRAVDHGRVLTLDVSKTEKGTPYALTGNVVDDRGFMFVDQLNMYETTSQLNPGVIRHSRSGSGCVFIDSVLYILNGVSKDGLTFKSIGRIYWVKLTDAEIAAAAKTKEDKKKGMSMKEKLAAAKSVVTDGVKGDVRYEKILHTNLDEMISNYLKRMNDTQLKENKSKEAEMATDVAASKSKELKMRQSQSREYAKKLNAQKDGGDTKFTIKNNRSERLYVMTESGTSSWISGGGSSTYPCGNKMYYCSKDAHNTYNVRGALIADGKTQCGKTVVAE